MSESNIKAYVNYSFTLLKSAYYIKFSFSTDCLSQLFTWIELCDVELRYSFSNKANSVEGEVHQPLDYYHQRNQSISVTDGVIVWSGHGSCMPNRVRTKICAYRLRQSLKPKIVE
jgi:hypothetical protein